jgi:Dolichyl-phosphate-mannose-protein mannosyltransferase
LIRDCFLRAFTIAGVALVAITETLSAFGALRRAPVVACWALLAVGAGIAILRAPRRRLHWPRVDAVAFVCVAGIAWVLLMTGITAAFSPPNSADAMAYHMPRVLYWAEQASVRFFPTQYLNQIMLQPLAEYGMLHLYLLSGSDRLTNFVQWFGSLASIVGVSAVAGELGFGARGQAMAALFCATLPAGVLASSGAKNDYFMAMWLVAAVYFALRFTRSGRRIDALFLGAALGCALLTKATAYLFAAPLLAAIFVIRREVRLKPRAAGATVALVCGFLINLPLYARNYGLSGSPLGFDSAFGNGSLRWRNEAFGWRETVSNMLRNTSQQLGARSARWNRDVYDAVLWIHQRLGIDVNDPRTTWRWSSFAPPRNANQEADAPNRWELLMLVVAGCVLLWRAARGRDRLLACYAVALFAGFVLFCAYLKWQPFMARLFLPLFVVASPIVAITGEPVHPRFAKAVLAAQLVLCWFLLDNARLPVLENWTRPLEGPRSVLRVPRDRQYFADMVQWRDQIPSYFSTADLLAQNECRTVGIDLTDFQLEYPLMALLRERDRRFAFLHTGVENASKRYRQPVSAEPCAVVCLDCAGDPARLGVYAGYPRAVTIGRFVVLLR